MTILKLQDRWIARSTYAEKDLVKGAGWLWDPDSRQWWTKIPERAAKLAQYASPEIREELTRMLQGIQEQVAASRATDADIELPCPSGKAYLPFQRAGIAYALRCFTSGRRAVLIGDEMGLGKTIQTIGVINAVPEIRKVLVVCPASLKLNWFRELESWLVRKLSIQVLSGGKPFVAATDITIINYDLLEAFALGVHSVQWDLVVVDECHYIKNNKAKRTKAIVGDDKGLEGLPAKRVLFLTGTPILNRPMELWTLLHYADPKEWRSFMKFATRYCGAYHNGWGWDFGGATNLDELQERLRKTFMVRRLKKDVLTELPPKRRQVVSLATNGAAKLVEEENTRYQQFEEHVEELETQAELASVCGDEDTYKAAVVQLSAARRVAFTEMAEVRHQVAVAKAPQAVDFITDLLENEGKVVVWAHHHDVIDLLASKLGAEVVVVDGRVSEKDRQAAVDRFQNDPVCRVFIGGIKAAGVGLTLTAASTEVFVELDWVPGNLTQAEDRCHRIGQVNPVLIYHLVFDGSLDSRMAKILISKQEIAERALDCKTKVEGLDATANLASEPRTTSEPEVKSSIVSATVAALRWLAGMCDGAVQLDDRGFNKMDAGFGHKLAALPHLTAKQVLAARKMVRKYKRQIPQAVYAALEY